MNFVKINSLQHPLVKHLVKIRTDKDFRNENKTLVVFGKKQIEELPNHIKIIHLLTLDETSSCRNAEKKIIVTEEILKKITAQKKPEPFVAEVSFPSLKIEAIKRLLICDEIQDPGNLGTLLRTATSFGFDACFLLNHCVDPFNEKSLQAGKGAVFNLPLIYGDFESLLSLQKEHNLTLYQADIKGESFTTCDFKLPLALILGNEAKGTSAKAKEIGIAITVPMTSNMESLNVGIAGGILMFNVSAYVRN